MKPRIIAVANQKGGVGKTTTAVNLGVALAKLGKRVLLVDLDPQANATAGLGVDHRQLERGIYHPLTLGAEVKEVIRPTQVDGLHLAPSTIDLAGATVELVNMESREYKLQYALQAVHPEYDYIIIDCPPALDLLTVNALVAAREVLIPVQTEYYSLEGLGSLLKTIELVQNGLNRDLQILGALMTMYDERYRLTHDVFNELHKHFPEKVFRTVIPRNIKLAEAPSFGRSIFHHDPRSSGANAYRRLAKEVAAETAGKRELSSLSRRAEPEHRQR